MTLAVSFEKQIIGSFGHDFEFPTVLSYLKDGRMQAKPLITDKIKLDEIVEQGFKELIHNKEKHIKILVSPQ
jgi:(R,R)-butanediol dehydrogenase/meso-butanediol dehydrogenase/diacetyl reductase